jgi:phosphohistidine phosphatase
MGWMKTRCWLSLGGQMKTLLLMRHAKSQFKETEIPDFERPLSKRGEKDAPRMGKLIKDKGLSPDLIISSTAVRAARTAEAVAEKSGYKGEVIYNQSLYLGEPDVYLETLRSLEDDKDNDIVLVIGHNPGMESLLQVLSDKVESLPTGAVAYLRLPIRSWSALTPDIIATLAELWRPRDLK